MQLTGKMKERMFAFTENRQTYVNIDKSNSSNYEGVNLTINNNYARKDVSNQHETHHGRSRHCDDENSLGRGQGALPQGCVHPVRSPGAMYCNPGQPFGYSKEGGLAMDDLHP